MDSLLAARRECVALIAGDDSDFNERLNALFDVGDRDFSADAEEMRAGVERAEADVERLFEATNAEAVAAASVVSIDVRAALPAAADFEFGLAR